VRIKVREARDLKLLLKSALLNAKMENANFGKDDNFIKERTKLYMNSWVVGPLEEALKLLNEVEVRYRKKGAEQDG